MTVEYIDKNGNSVNYEQRSNYTFVTLVEKFKEEFKVEVVEPSVFLDWAVEKGYYVLVK